jgi:transposase
MSTYSQPQKPVLRRPVESGVFTAIVYVLTTGCAWRHLPAACGILEGQPKRPWQRTTCRG